MTTIEELERVQIEMEAELSVVRLMLIAGLQNAVDRPGILRTFEKLSKLEVIAARRNERVGFAEIVEQIVSVYRDALTSPLVPE